MEQLAEYARSIPIEILTFFITFVEEIFPPLPLGLLLVSAGTLSAQRGYGLLFILWIILLSALAKTAAGWILYALSDKAEDVVVKKFGHYLGVSHKDIEHIGSRLTGRWRDWVVMFLLRFIPFIPSTPISVGAGVIHMPIKLYLVTTFFGALCRNAIFILAGYQGSLLVDIRDINIQPQDILISGFVIPTFLALFGIWYIKKRRDEKNH